MFWLKKQTIKWFPVTGTGLWHRSLFFWLCLKSCEILISWPRIGSRPLVVQVLTLNHWTTREVPWKPSCSSPQIGWEHVACFQDYCWHCSVRILVHQFLLSEKRLDNLIQVGKKTGPQVTNRNPKHPRGIPDCFLLSSVFFISCFTTVPENRGLRDQQATQVKRSSAIDVIIEVSELGGDEGEAGVVITFKGVPQMPIIQIIF